MRPSSAAVAYGSREARQGPTRRLTRFLGSVGDVKQGVRAIVAYKQASQWALRFVFASQCDTRAAVQAHVYLVDSSRKRMHGHDSTSMYHRCLEALHDGDCKWRRHLQDVNRRCQLTLKL